MPNLTDFSNQLPEVLKSLDFEKKEDNEELFNRQLSQAKEFSIKALSE